MNGASSGTEHLPFKKCVHHFGVLDLADRLRALRTSATPPISVREMAEAIGISHTGYHRYEARNGYKQRWLPMDFARRVASVLADRGVNPDDVLALAGVEGGESTPLGLTAGQQQWVELYEKVTPEQRRAVLALLRTMVPPPSAAADDRAN